MSKILEFLAKFLLIPLIKDFSEWVKKRFEDKKEESSRVETNNQATENYQTAQTPEDRKKRFNQMP